MNKRGQAALEYLMTYGWALIVIAIVVGVLVFIVSSPAGNIVCNSSDPAKIMTKASKIAASADEKTAAGDILISNITGGDLLVTADCTGGGAFANITKGTNGCGAATTFKITSGETTTLKPTFKNEVGTVGTTVSYAQSTLKMSYTDYASLSRDVTITCSGPVTLKIIDAI